MHIIYALHLYVSEFAVDTMMLQCYNYDYFLVSVLAARPNEHKQQKRISTLDFGIVSEVFSISDTSKRVM